MNKLCFLSNLTSDEWAAWAQAVGTLLAIGAAIWIASRQHRNDVAKAERERAERAEQIKQVSTVFGDQLAACIADLVDYCVMENRGQFYEALAHLNVIIEFSRSVNVAELPAAAIWPFMSLRTIAAKLAHYTESTALLPGFPFPKAKEGFEKYRSEASAANQQLVTAFGV